MTDFRARGTIMGLAGLTAVFGMGTGVAPPVWSPESRPAGGQAGRSRSVRWSGHAVASQVGACVVVRVDPGTAVELDGDDRRPSIGIARTRRPVGRRASGAAAAGRGGQADRLLGPVGCGGRPPYTPGLSTWSSSRSLQY